MSKNEVITFAEAQVLLDHRPAFEAYLRQTLGLDKGNAQEWALYCDETMVGLGFGLRKGTMHQEMFCLFPDPNHTVQVVYSPQDYISLDDVFRCLGYDNHGDMVPGNAWVVRGWVTQQARLRKLRALVDDQEGRSELNS